MYITPPKLGEHHGTKDRKNGNAEIKELAAWNADFRAWHRFCIFELSGALVICTRYLQD